MSKKLHLHFSKSFSANIWEQSLSEDRILFTLRDQEKMQVSFSLMDLSDGSLIFEDISFEENWWVSAYHFFGNVIVFQFFEDTQNIESKSYFALDINSHEAIWSLEEVMAVGRSGDFIQLRTTGADEGVFWIDIRSGETHESKPDDYIPNGTSYEQQFPLHYTEESPHFGTLRAFLKQKISVEAKGAFDYLERDGLIMMAWHEAGAEGLEHGLLVLTEEGELLLRQPLDTKLKGLVSGAFFIAGEQLIFVEGRNTLKSYLIGD